jgi:hypothetical protein
MLAVYPEHLFQCCVQHHNQINEKVKIHMRVGQYHRIKTRVRIRVKIVFKDKVKVHREHPLQCCSQHHNQINEKVPRLVLGLQLLLQLYLKLAMRLVVRQE